MLTAPLASRLLGAVVPILTDVVASDGAGTAGRRALFHLTLFRFQLTLPGEDGEALP